MLDNDILVGLWKGIYTIGPTFSSSSQQTDISYKLLQPFYWCD